MNVAGEIKAAIRDIPDFPKKGIVFKDITPLLADPKIFNDVISAFAEKYKNRGITKVLGVESRGFLLAAPVALRIGAGMVPVRKKGKLPHKTVSATYALEYGTDTLEMHEDAIRPGEKILIIDDVLATGGTCAAVCEMAEKLGGRIDGIGMLIELTFLNGKNKLDKYDLFSLIKY